MRRLHLNKACVIHWAVAVLAMVPTVCLEAGSEGKGPSSFMGISLGLCFFFCFTAFAHLYQLKNFTDVLIAFLVTPILWYATICGCFVAMDYVLMMRR